MRKRYSLLLLAAVSVTSLLAGCQKPDAANPAQTTAPSSQGTRAGDVTPSTFRPSTLVAAFSDAGFSARLQPAEGQNIFGSGAEDLTLSIGTAGVMVFVFANESVAKKAAAGVSAEGSSIPRVSKSGVVEAGGIYEFRGRVHFYARDRVLALFVESGPRSSGQPPVEKDERVIKVLESAMGPQFAGS